jgi:hypothetical protein
MRGNSVEDFKYFDVKRASKEQWDKATYATRQYLEHYEWLINLAYEDGYNDGRRNGINHWLGSKYEPRFTYEQHLERSRK